MIDGSGPFVQTLFGTLFTWGLTAAGAGLVFVFKAGKRKVLDGSLGFAAGVMTAASFWSLLAPAIEMAEQSGMYGRNGQWAFVPVTVGFLLGAVFVYSADLLIPHMEDEMVSLLKKDETASSVVVVDGDYGNGVVVTNAMNGLQKRRPQSQSKNAPQEKSSPVEKGENRVKWKRILLLIVAITIHNIPEGLAVGVGFGAIGKSASATFENARNLAIGIGIQNFPEGLAVSLPLRGAGFSTWKSFWYGQLSGMVEPIAGIFGALAVTVAEPILPYALAFAAGAMIYVVVDDILPEAQTCGNGRLTSWCCVLGFLTMMALDVGLS